MKKLFLVSIIALFSLSVFAQDEGFGLGLIIGEPTGLSAKVWTSERTAVDAALAWSFYGHGGWIHIHSNFLMHNFDLFPVSKGRLPLYYGAGAYLSFAPDLKMGIRAPVGVAYHFEEIPLELFAELAPGLALLPGIGFYFGGGTGARYYF